MTNSDSELLNIFWVEVTEHLGVLNDALLKVEMAEGDEKLALLREMNRVAHSMKGAARAVGFGMIETVSHYMEEVFHYTLNRGMALTPDMADTLYDGLDLIQNAVAGEENDEEVIAAVLNNLERIVTSYAPAVDTNGDNTSASSTTGIPANETTPPDDQPEASDIATASPPAPAAAPYGSDAPHPIALIRPSEETIRVTVGKLDRLMAEASELLVLRMQGENRQRRLAQLRQHHSRWQREWRSVRAAYIRLVRRIQEQGSEISAEMNVIFKFLEANQRYLAEANREIAQLMQLSAQENMQLTTVADLLQDDVADLRMMPFDTITGGFQRMVRDIARDTHKQINFEISGAHVEIDKTVLDAMKDPLMHLLRNAIDHGIESPQEREATGKPAAGYLALRLEQRGSEIIIQVTDDGRGLDLDRIRRKAVARGLLTEAEASSLSDEETRLLVFHSGFSTSDTVTALSGRGLGLDIVRDRVETLRGRVSLSSSPGAGSTITLSVPVSLTRIRCILLRVGTEEYAVPSSMIARMETISRDAVYTAEGQEMVNINHKPMPLVSLATLLDTSADNNDNGILNLLALQTADRTVAFEVDDLYSEMELVLKPLGPELTGAPFIAGAALRGSGEIIIVLDANDLVRKASGDTIMRSRTRLPLTAASSAPRRLRVLIVDDSITTRTLEKNILEAVGFEVHVAIDGVEAWSMLNELTPDVIISDVEMPNMNGLELVRRIKGHTHTNSIPVILLTSLAKPEQREEGLRAGADAYLVKSRFDQGELLDTIQSVL